MTKVGIIGAAGYTAGELIRILVYHPEVNITVLQSSSQSQLKVSDIHIDLIGEALPTFQSEINPTGADIWYLCKGHGASLEILKNNPQLLDKMVIYMSQDFRLADPSHDFVYGLPEYQKEAIRKSRHLANPGCFATCIQLGLLPSWKEQLVNGDIQISGITGSTGAGQGFSKTSYFSWRSNNASVYKPLTHQHMLEVTETCRQLMPGKNSAIHFIPYRGAFPRGIIITSHFETSLDTKTLQEAYARYYTDHPFVLVADQMPDIKQVVNTNKCAVFPTVIAGRAVIVSVIDNLLKGASGQAVQNMNLMMGWNETMGLNLKASAF